MPLSTNPHHLAALNHRHVVSSVSTNSELIDALKEGSLRVDEPHLFTAETQTAGRGQRGRSWQSPHGNVYLSLYHPVTMPVSGLLSLVIGVELAKMPVIQALNKHLIVQNLPPIGVKWANDLGFYNNQQQGSERDGDNTSETDQMSQHIIYFNKLAGILIEPVWQLGKLVGVVMGVGLNVKATPKLTTQTLEGMSYQALSLQDISQLTTVERYQIPSLQEIYQQISTALVLAIERFEQLALEKTTTQHCHTDDFLRQFDAVDALAGLRVQVTQNHNGEPLIITGDACGIDTNGCLQLRQDSGKLATLFTGRIDVIYDTDS